MSHFINDNYTQIAKKLRSCISFYAKTLSPEVDREDILNRVLLKAYTRFNWEEEFIPERFNAWLRKVARRELLDAHRSINSRRRREIQSEQAHMSFFDVEDPEMGVEEVAALKEEAALAEALVWMLPENYALPMLLKSLEDMDNQEIAEELGISSNLVAQRLVRARRAIQKLVDDGGVTFFEGFERDLRFFSEQYNMNKTLAPQFYH
jgi:RNA polymerase sigma factor (sigma-70 family)